MAHAGTMVGGSAQTKQNGSPWPAIALTLAVVVATIAGVWLASSAGIVGTAAKPAADRSYDQIEAQRGLISASVDHSVVTFAAPRGVSPTSGITYFIQPPLRIVGSKSVLVGETQGNVGRLPFSTPSGTFQTGKTADDQVVAPVIRDRIGGP